MTKPANPSRWWSACVPMLLFALALGGCSLASPDQAPSSVPKTFVADGNVARLGEGDGDAVTLSSLVGARIGNRDRLVIAFADSSGLPARRLGGSRVELLRGQGVLRVWLPGRIERAAMTETWLSNDLLVGAYVVHSMEGQRFVDVHLRAPAVARAWQDDRTAAIVIEFEAGGDPLPAAAARGARVVLMLPRAGPTGYPLQVWGYARTFEANVVAELMVDGRIVQDTFTTAADYVEMWGEFRLMLPGGPSGEIELRVGEGNAETGEWEGTSVRLTLP
ncbi:MAG: hypothetical protein HOP12_09335 [Candidatus Eisenbacteria bacterium]|uniref:Bacterial spore germination immunoglobulin-like domain-containing protein n=1 Tax=Eiseniibacteriota bacterium TaxID=2212470 RepID=A0A849SF42_UNCEI|nr:hypothetical protein [Candidatus Eisenbacteria bacterium]